MTSIQEKLWELQDKDYALFQSKLTPNVDPSLFIGVRVPVCRKLARELIKNNKDEVRSFLAMLPHNYYDEDMLHGMIISEVKEFDQCIEALQSFLPYVNNWAVCDTISPKCFKKNRKALLPIITTWIDSSEEYTIRFGLEMLMSHYLDEDFSPEYLRMAASVKSDRYYVNMMIAWYFATALAKQWKDTIIYLEDSCLDVWVHNKTIQKARESFRITDEQKAYLKNLKRSN